MKDALPIWVIYWNPKDYPGRYVVRRQCVLPGGQTLVDPSPSWVGGTLMGARLAVPPHTVLMARHPEDDPVIVETWL